jgi:hypothetical protein
MMHQTTLGNSSYCWNLSSKLYLYNSSARLGVFFTLPIYNTYIFYIIYMEQYECNVVLICYELMSKQCY